MEYLIFNVFISPRFACFLFFQYNILSYRYIFLKISWKRGVPHSFSGCTSRNFWKNISHFSQNFSLFSKFLKFLKFLKISQISQISQNFWEFLSFSQISHFFMNFPRNWKKIIIKLFVLNTIVVYFWWRK